MPKKVLRPSDARHPPRPSLPEALRFARPRKLTRAEEHDLAKLEQGLTPQPGDLRVRPSLRNSTAIEACGDATLDAAGVRRVAEADPEFWKYVEERAGAGDYVVPVDAEKYRRDRDNRAKGRHKQADKGWQQFQAQVWPKLELEYGKPEWREKAHQLCSQALRGWKEDDRALDRLLEKGRNAGVVPRLRAPKHR